ncbi:hypothetical protein ACHHYP_20570, partial [Achlya hypogyna]
PLVVQSDAPAKALGILVAPFLLRRTRVSYALDKYAARLSQWSYKSSTLAGKVAVLSTLCLPVLWYQLVWVTPSATEAACIDRMTLQFLRGQPISRHGKSRGHLLSQDIAFALRERGGLGLTRALAMWTSRQLALARHMLRSANLMTDHGPLWLAPSRALVSLAYAPWGNLHDLLHGDTADSEIARLLRSAALPARWPNLLRNWPHDRARLQTHHMPQMLARLHFGTTRHLLATTYYCLGRPATERTTPVSMITSLNVPVPSTPAACASPQPAAQAPSLPVPQHCLLPTRHLRLPVDFILSAAAVDHAATFFRPDYILPKYSDFVYRIVIGAVPVRARLGFLPATQRGCVFCDSLETLEHLLLQCAFSQRVWAGLAPLTSALQLQLPTTLQSLLFETPYTPLRHRRRSVATLWPILRACVLYTIWLARNDAVFRPEVPAVSLLAAAHRAAQLIRLHIHHLLLNTQDDAVFRLMHALLAEAWTRTFILVQPSPTREFRTPQ